MISLNSAPEQLVNLNDLRAYNLVFLSTPYRKYKLGLSMAYREASRIHGRLIIAGLKCFCPIGHSHGAAFYGGVIPTANELWREQNMPFMRACDVLLVAKMDGWNESDGIRDEIKHFETERKPIYYLDPRTFGLSAVA